MKVTIIKPFPSLFTLHLITFFIGCTIYSYNLFSGIILYMENTTEGVIFLDDIREEIKDICSSSVGMSHAPGDRYDGFTFGFRPVRNNK